MHDRVRSERVNERSHSRRKHTEVNNGEDYHQNPNVANNYPYDDDASQEPISPNSEDISPNMSETSWDKGHSNSNYRRQPSAKHRHSNSSRYSGTHDYVNDVRYSDNGDEEFEENYPIQEESVRSGSGRGPVSRNVISNRRSERSRSQPPASNRSQYADSVSDFNTQSLADGTPQALGGSEQDFWNPDLGATDSRPSAPALQSTPPTPFRKLLASFRRLKRNKANESSGVLAERSATDSQLECVARVIMLDGEELNLELTKNDTGHTLFTRVCQTADIVETDYFGLTYVNNKLRTWFWLDMDKKITKQLRNGEQWLFSFQVKFYPPEPTLLQEDITRYQLTLQVRQDIYTGKLPCSWVTQALLGSFMVQAELGDYDEREHGNSIDYLKEFEFISSPTPQLLQKIWELHKTHVGMKPNQADVKYLETAKRLELYGIDLHPVRDTENVEIYLGVGFHGIVIYRERLRIGRFAWPKVLRISYKKNNFFLKIRPDNSEPVETIIGFRLLNHHLANRLWKAAVEHHAFFRLKEARSPRNSLSAVGSNFNYIGHTFFQYRTMNINRPHPNFDRSLTKRRTASMPLGLNKTPSIHTLSRAHPRDMTVGRTQESDLSTGRGASSARHVNSNDQLSSQASHTFQSGMPRTNRRYSNASKSSRDNYATESQSHDYINVHQAAPLTELDRGSYLSGSMISEPTVPPVTSRSSQRFSQASNRRPESPLHKNSRHPPSSPDRAMTREKSHQSGSVSHPNRGSSFSRKPPGGIPVLSGVMLGTTASKQGSVSDASRHTYDDEGLEAEVDDFDTALEYDDDTVDEAEHVRTAAYGRDYSHQRHSAKPSLSEQVKYQNGSKKPRASAHTPRRGQDNSELML